MALQWRDTPESYGLVTRLLHWTMALILLWQFTGMILRLVLGRTPLMAFWVGTHQSIGSVLLMLIVLRLLWAWANRKRRPGHDRSGIGRAALVGQLALYALLLVVPALALLRALGSGRGFAFFGHQVVERTGQRIEWMAGPADLLHSKLAWLLMALILGHAAMALVHHVVWRDGVLMRMGGRGARRPADGRPPVHASKSPGCRAGPPTTSARRGG
ncbi:cytochrome b [Roseomonas eburnea]|uniref:Cytochrome b n=1 Tax=Neoroseomonas eburnea TaxID=1346889 RepID=A0A9X9X9R7_9PROT|nr:cytochrome b/b6 domain-containing protein [Neoroseomonas eburnea]MBR0680453.1 cytochrome b [Neoroseomonas eburnea]